MIGHLKETENKAPFSWGLGKLAAIPNAKYLLEVWTAPDGNWTLLMTVPLSGRSCILDQGEGWTSKRGSRI